MAIENVDAAALACNPTSALPIAQVTAHDFANAADVGRELLMGFGDRPGGVGFGRIRRAKRCSTVASAIVSMKVNIKLSRRV